MICGCLDRCGSIGNARCDRCRIRSCAFRTRSRRRRARARRSRAGGIAGAVGDVTAQHASRNRSGLRRGRLRLRIETGLRRAAMRAARRGRRARQRVLPADPYERRRNAGHHDDRKLAHQCGRAEPDRRDGVAALRRVFGPSFFTHQPGLRKARDVALDPFPVERKPQDDRADAGGGVEQRQNSALGDRQSATRDRQLGVAQRHAAQESGCVQRPDCTGEREVVATAALRDDASCPLEGKAPGAGATVQCDAIAMPMAYAGRRTYASAAFVRPLDTEHRATASSGDAHCDPRFAWGRVTPLLAPPNKTAVG